MGWRARFERRRFLSPGAVLVGGLRVWFRGLPVALMVVLLSGAPVLLLAAQVDDPFVPNSELPVDVAVTAYANTTVATWFGAILLFESIGFHQAGVLSGILALALCYAATGLLASLLYFRSTAGRWRGTSFAAVGRLVAFAVLVAFGLVLVKAMLVKVLLVGWGVWLLLPYLLLVVTILEAWLFCRHWLVLPILAIERVSLAAAIGRSRKLTRGSGFAVFGIVALLAFLSIVFFTVQGAMGFADRHSYARSVAPVAVLLTTIQAAMLAAGYRQLRELREGPDEHDVARVFD